MKKINLYQNKYIIILIKFACVFNLFVYYIYVRSNFHKNTFITRKFIVVILEGGEGLITPHRLFNFCVFI